LTALVTAAALVIVAASGTPKGPTVLPSPEALPRNTVVVVSHVPVSRGRITKAEFQRGMIEGAAQARRKAVPKPGGKGYEKLKEAVVGELLDAIWIHGQAEIMGIVITPRQVARERARLIEQAFKSKAQYHRFLVEAHFTRRDVDERVEIQLISFAIQQRVQRRAGGANTESEVFRDFVEAYEKRWRARTVCAPEYLVDRCSNGSSPPAAP
jgi:hypothetical protein